MKKRFLPKAWLKDWFYGEYKNSYAGVVNLFVRLGRWRSFDDIASVREEIFVLPSFCFSFNHSELSLRFVWLNFECYIRHKNWKSEDAYRKKMMEK